MSRSFGVTSFTTRSPIRTRPSLMSSSPAAMRSAVVLPHPDGPTRTMNSPFTTLRSSWSTALVPSGKTFETASKTPLATGLLLDAAADEPAHEGPLRDHEDDRDREHRDDRRDRELRLEDVRRTSAAADRRVERRRRREQVLEPDGDRQLLRVRQDDVRQEEVVPVRDEREEEDERQHRLGERHRNPQEGLELAGALDARSLEQRRRQRRDVVDVGEVDAEREEREGQDHRPWRPDHLDAEQVMDGVHLEVDREHERRTRDDHRDERQRKDQPASREVAEREAVAGRDADDQRERRRGHRVPQRVQNPVAVDVVAEVVQVLPGQGHLMEAPEAEWAVQDERVV